MRLLTVLLFLWVAAVAQAPKAYFENPVIRHGQDVLWHDPGAVEALDFRYGIGGPELAPVPPYTFLSEDKSGSSPKVYVRDARGRTWDIKFGEEASPDTFCTRLVWACGYYAEPTYYVADGVIEGVHHLGRAASGVDANGRFRGGRFQLRSSEPKYLRSITWSWDDNPFLGAPELNGLKILMMLVSNWDDKDGRNAEGGGTTNNAVYQLGDLRYYFIDDWGGSMGRWGKYFSRSKWDYKGFLHQSPDFVTANNGSIHWGYVGKHSHLVTRDFEFGNISWLMKYLGRVTDEQLRVGLLASGASEEAAQSYIDALHIRIRALQKIAAGNLTQRRGATEEY